MQPHYNLRMSLVAEYRQQFFWRSWNLILDEVPIRAGQTVLDLGCGVGDQSRELASRGCKVLGIDGNDEFVKAAKLLHLSDCEFRSCDLRDAPDVGLEVQGIWCSFVAAYFVDLVGFLKRWAYSLQQGGWLAITEIDDLFGHEPLSKRTKFLLESYVEEGLAAGRYDFRMGSKLKDYVPLAGFTVTHLLEVSDRELAFNGPASPEVVVAWRMRFQRMPLLKSMCGSEFEKVQEEFLACLTRSDHVSTAKVMSCIATKTD